MFVAMRTRIWVLPETKLLEIPIGKQLLDDPLSVSDVLELGLALDRLQDCSAYGEVCIEDDTVVVIPREKGFLDRVVHNPWTYMAAFASAIPAVAIASAADAIMNKNPKGNVSDMDRVSGMLSGDLLCPKISAKYGVNVKEQVHIPHPMVLVTGQARNAFERWMNIAASKDTCMHIFVGEIHVGHKKTRGVITYPLSDADSAETVIERFASEAGLQRGQLKQVSPLDASDKNLAAQGLKRPK